jgi:hypothetical protein
MSDVTDNKEFKMIVKNNEIEKLYSEKIAALIMAGYTISIEHTHGSQSYEVSAVALTNNNGKTVIKVALISERVDWKKEKLKLVTLGFKDADNGRTLWNHKGDVVEEITFYEVDREKKVYTDDEQELEKIISLRSERFKSRYQQEEIIDSEKMITAIWKMARKKDGYKSLKKKDIVRIVRDRKGFIVHLGSRPSFRKAVKGV